MNIINDKELYDQRHGGSFDRGSADSWYSRPIDPHYFVGGSYDSEIIQGDAVSKEEADAYFAGYQWNEKFGDKKDWS